MKGSYLFSVASRTIRRAAWLESSRLHLCALNCSSMSALASGCPLKGSCAGNCMLQNSQIPSTELLVRRTILSFRFAMIRLSVALVGIG